MSRIKILAVSFAAMLAVAATVFAFMHFAGNPRNANAGSQQAHPAPRSPAASASSAPTSEPTPTPTPLPLAGRTIVIDPGHQLGNYRHTREVTKLVDAGGGQRKACNTTGTSTNDGFAESTFAFNVATELRPKLEALGATVLMTRNANSTDSWGPCINDRAALGNAENADLKISIHGDGSAASHHGFHIIVSTQNKSWHENSHALAIEARTALEAAGFARSTYIGGGTALSLRDDIGTLNLSNMPSIMAELGNMRNTNDAVLMASTEGQQRYATALADAAVAYLASH